MSVTWQHLTIISTNNDWSKYNLLKMSLNMKGIWAIKHVWKSYIEVASDVFRSQFFNMPIMNSGFVFQWTLAAQQHQRAAPLSRNFVAKRKFSKKITNRNELPDLSKKLYKYLPPNTASFIKTQLLINQKRSKNGYRWSLKDKMFAMSIFHHSRKVYDILRKLFILPSKATILNTIQKSEIYAGFNNNIFAALKQKVSTMVQADKQCILTLMKWQ